MERITSMYKIKNRPLKENMFMHTCVALAFIMDEALLPVFHPMGIPLKISYVILLVAVVFHFLSIKINKNWIFRFEDGSEARKVIYWFFALILLSCMGEATMLIHSNIQKGEPFTDALLNFAFMIAAFVLGYSIYRYNKKVLLWALYFYSALNMALLLFYGSLPGIVKRIYSDYYASGVRIRGTGGNANTTILVMNIILLSIVVLFKLRKIKITGIHTWLVFIVPIMTNIFISSRGEFIHTILLELFYVYLLFKTERNKGKTFIRIVVIVVLIIAVYLFVFGYLYNTNDSVKYGIDRLFMISEVTDVDGYETGEVDTLMRPFFRADVFWARFKHSPIWGAGYSFGDADDFIKSANGYHNDWFRVLASTGLLGLCCWFAIVKKFVKRSSIVVLLPFFLAGLSNTFLQSTHALNIYFFLFGVVMHILDTNRQIQEDFTHTEV